MREELSGLELVLATIGIEALFLIWCLNLPQHIPVATERELRKRFLKALKKHVLKPELN